MAQFLLRRLGLVLVTLFLISLIVFAVTTVLPGDAAQVILGQRATPETLAALRARLGLDRPAPLRYVEWLGSILSGDWGESLVMNLPVGPLLAQRLRNSLVLAALALAISTVLGIGLGIIAGLTRNRWPDHWIALFTLFFVSFPPFITGTFLIVVFAAWLRWLPASSLIEADANLWTAARFLILPTLALTLSSIAEVTRMMRSSLIAVMNSEYIRTARSKGLPQRTVILRHALRNALLPTISIVALNVGYLLSGVVLVESVFAYPGLGRLMLQAISQRDLPLIQAVALVTAAIYALANLAADLLYHWLNPQIRYT